MNGRLCHEQRPQSLVSEQGFQFLFAVAFDDEIAIEFRVTDFDILQPQQLADSAEQAAARHAKAEVVGIDVGRPQAGEWYGNLAGVHMEQVERDSPVMVLDFDLVALPCPTFDEVTADFLAELFPDFLISGPKSLLRRDMKYQPSLKQTVEISLRRGGDLLR